MTEPLLPPLPEGLKVLRNAHGFNHYFTHLQMDKYGRDCATAAIQHYIVQQAAPKTQLDEAWKAGFRRGAWGQTVDEKLVEACEMVDALIEHQFTGTSAGMNDLQYACDAVHAALDSYKKHQEMNTSQERVQKSEEFKQMLEAAYLAGFNGSSEGYNAEYGANTAHPMWIKDRDNAIAAITTGGSV